MKEVASGMVGMVFLALCIGFLSSIQPAPRAASAHPFLAPGGEQTAAAASFDTAR